MNLLDQHKALIITFLITGIVVFGMFSMHIKQKDVQIAESYYELEPEPDADDLEKLEKLPDLNGPSTNKAFNEDQEFKALMKNFKTVSSNDFERTTKALEDAKLSTKDEEISTTKSYANTGEYALKENETESFNKLKDVLNKRKSNQEQAAEHASYKSTLSYSLKGRTLLSYKTPRYLCETSGKIVVTIKVNAQGEVFDAYINGASSSDNQCLTDHAIEYAKSVLFNSSSKSDQLGTITFYFKGKN